MLIAQQLLTSLGSALLVAVGGTLAAWYLARVRAGRFGRTLEQSNKLLDFVEHYCKVRDELEKFSVAEKPDMAKLLANAMDAVRDDFVADRATFSDFETDVSTVKAVLLLRIPARPLLWVPQLLFHTLLIFSALIFVLRLMHPPWQIVDALVVGSALCIAVVVGWWTRRVT